MSFYYIEDKLFNTLASAREYAKKLSKKSADPVIIKDSNMQFKA